MNSCFSILAASTASEAERFGQATGGGLVSVDLQYLNQRTDPRCQLSGNVPLSTHVYTYSPSGNIKSWSQTTDTSSAKTWGIAYDRADQLEAATLTSSSAAVLEQHAWRYDKIGNRTSRSVGVPPTLSNTRSTHNNRNQITSESPGGWMRVRGITNEPATVKVRSNANPFTPATTTAGNEFSGWVTTVPGVNSVTIEAKDTSPNANPRTNSYTINVTGSSRTPTYDLNGNTTANGSGQTYQWDAEDRLIKITYADASSTAFIYDGLSRRVRITERNSLNAITGDKRYLWASGNQPAEERDATGNTVLKQYHPQGEFVPAAIAPLNKLFYTRDHLGSVRELVDGNGTFKTRYDYDMWGKRKITGTIETDVGYTGHHHHANSGLILTWFRAYDTESGRWLSADPIGESGGMNLYGYVGNDPVNAIDPLGLQKLGCPLIDKDSFQDIMEGKKQANENQDFSKGAIEKYRQSMLEAARKLQDASGNNANSLRAHMNKMNLRMQQLQARHGMAGGSARMGMLGVGDALIHGLLERLNRMKKEQELENDKASSLNHMCPRS